MEPLKKKDETLQIRCHRSTIIKFRTFVSSNDFKNYEEAILALIKVGGMTPELLNQVRGIKDWGIIRGIELRKENDTKGT